MRKIIQICSHQEPGSYPYVVALCEDGTAWEFMPPALKNEDMTKGYWQQMPVIPQNKPNSFSFWRNYRPGGIVPNPK